MFKPVPMLRRMSQALTGNMPPTGSFENVDEIAGFAFGIYYNSEGGFGIPGPINEALAHFMVNNEVVREKYITAQDALAWAIVGQDKTLSSQINAVPTVKAPFKAFTGREFISAALPGWNERNVHDLGVVAYRNHLPRAAAETGQATGFVIATPDMRGVGNWDPNPEQQRQARRPLNWAVREIPVQLIETVLGRI